MSLYAWYLNACSWGFDGSFEDWIEHRAVAKTDLFRYGRDILGFALVNAPHREMLDVFPKLNCTEGIFNQGAPKQTFTMVARGSFKSSANQSLCSQIFLNFPNARIAILCAASDLSTAFTDKIRSFFSVAKEDGSGRYTLVQRLFPEHCILERRLPSEDRFTTPARTKTITEPTILAISVGQSTSGKHFEFVFSDDVEDNRNSGPSAKPETRLALAEAIKLSRSLLDPAGYRFMAGTPYGVDSPYLPMLERKTMRVLRKPAWTLKAESRSKKPEELTESDYNLFFPKDANGDPRLTYSFLCDIRDDDSGSDKVFACQYLVSPRTSKTVRFTDQLLDLHIAGPETFPTQYIQSINCWDLAYSLSDDADYTVGAHGLATDDGRMFVCDVVRGRFSKRDLVFQIAKLAHVSDAVKIRIEGTPGASFLEDSIVESYARLCNASRPCPQIEFFPVDRTPGAKNTRAELLEGFLIDGRLWFSNQIAILSVIRREFLQYAPSKNRKDDTVDGVAFLCQSIREIRSYEEVEIERHGKVLDELNRKLIMEMIFPDCIEQPVEVPTPTLTTWDGYPVLDSSYAF